MADQPAPPENNWAPEFVYVAEPSRDWRLDGTRRCRYTTGPGRKQCQKPSAAALNRGRHIWGKGTVDSWWGYCPRHLFGNWIEDGLVMGWVLRKQGAGNG